MWIKFGKYILPNLRSVCFIWFVVGIEELNGMCKLLNVSLNKTLTSIHIYIYIYTYTYTHTYIHTYICTCTLFSSLNPRYPQVLFQLVSSLVFSPPSDIVQSERRTISTPQTISRWTRKAKQIITTQGNKFYCHISQIHFNMKLFCTSAFLK